MKSSIVNTPNKGLGKVHFTKGSDHFEIEEAVYNEFAADMDNFDEIVVTLVGLNEDITDEFGTVLKTIRKFQVQIYGIEQDDDGRDTWMEVIHRFTYINKVIAVQSARRWVHILGEIATELGEDAASILLMGFHDE